jgi:hypothetical protein
MADFNTYKDAFPHAKLGRSPEGVIEVVLHANGSTLIFNGYTHEEFVDLFHAVGCDSANRVVILTGTGDAVMEEIAPEGFDFFTPAGYDKIYREGKKVLMKILCAVKTMPPAACTASTIACSSASEVLTSTCVE